MSTQYYRKCCKCGSTAIQDRTVPFYRFPKPGKNNVLKAKAWAIYCWPEKDWNDVNSLFLLHKQSKVLCGKHFEDSCFLDSSKKKVSKFAVPGTTQYVMDLMHTLREQAVFEQQDYMSSIAPVADSLEHEEAPAPEFVTDKYQYKYPDFISKSPKMRNIEIKAKVNNYEYICRIAEELSGTEGEIIKQDDTFYMVNNGRLKMRFYGDSSATLVRYDRPDEGGPKLCDYDLLQFSTNETDKAKQLDDILKKCLGQLGRVVKERKLYMVGQTRIHIDDVKDLGYFMELEVVLRPEQTVEEGKAIAKDLQTKLGVAEQDLISCAYMDLLNKR